MESNNFDNNNIQTQQLDSNNNFQIQQQHNHQSNKGDIINEPILSIQSLHLAEAGQQNVNKSMVHIDSGKEQMSIHNSQNYPQHKLSSKYNFFDQKFTLQHIENYILQQNDLLGQPMFERVKSFIMSILYAKYNESQNIVEKFKLIQIMYNLYHSSEEQVEEITKMKSEEDKKEQEISTIVPLMQCFLTLLYLSASTHSYDNIQQWSDIIQDENYITSVRMLTIYGTTCLVSQDIVSEFVNNKKHYLSHEEFLSKIPLFTYSLSIKDNQIYILDQDFRQVNVDNSDSNDGIFGFIMNCKDQNINLPKTLKSVCISQTENITLNARELSIKQLSVFNGMFIQDLITHQITSLTLVYVHNVEQSALMQLSNLQQLYLNNILFTDTEQQIQTESTTIFSIGEKILNLLQYWQNLKKLTLLNCQMPQTVCLKTRMPQLVELTVHDHCNLEVLQLNTDECQCINLAFIDISGELQIYGSCPLKSLRFVNTSTQESSSDLLRTENVSQKCTIQSLFMSQKSVSLSNCASQILQSFDPYTIQRKENAILESQLLQNIQSFTQGSSDNSVLLSLLIVEMYEIYLELHGQKMIQYFVMKVIAAFMSLDDEKIIQITNLSFDSSEKEIKQAAKDICTQILLSECTNSSEIKTKCTIANIIGLNQLILDLNNIFQKQNVEQQDQTTDGGVNLSMKLAEDLQDNKHSIMVEIGKQIINSAAHHCSVIYGAKGVDFFAVIQQNDVTELLTAEQNELQAQYGVDQCNAFVWDANNAMTKFDAPLRTLVYSSYLQREMVKLYHPTNLKSLSLSKCCFSDLWQCTELEYVTLNNVKYIVLSDFQYLRKLKGVVLYDEAGDSEQNLCESAVSVDGETSQTEQVGSIFNYLQNSKQLELLVCIQNVCAPKIVLEHDFPRLSFLQLYTLNKAPLYIQSAAASYLRLEQVNVGDANLYLDAAAPPPSLKYVTCANAPEVERLLGLKK